MSNNPQTLCRTCVTPIGYVDCPTGGWWAHETHPADEHDAVPGAWVDGDELMEAIAAEVWEHCAGEGTSLVVDDPRNIAGTAAAVARRLQPAEMEQLRRERDLAIAHDRQPYPTAWAYEQACKALRRKTEAIERVRALHVPDENGECRACGASFDPCPTIAALDTQPADGPGRLADEEQQAETETPVHVGGNAEDCPACEGTNPPYPFICPQPAPAAAPVAGQPPADRLHCPRCQDDITDYAEDDFVFRTGDERPYCSGECVVVAHRAGLPTEQPPADTGEEAQPRFVRVCIACPGCDHTLDEDGACVNGCHVPPAVVAEPGKGPS